MKRLSIYSYNNPILRCGSVVIDVWPKGYLVPNGSTTHEGVICGSERAAQPSELF